jgi:hypothetical protein
MQEPISSHSCGVMTRLSPMKQALIDINNGDSSIVVALQHLQAIARLRIDKANANQIINYLVTLIDILKMSNCPNLSRWCLELDSLCFRLSIPRGEFRFSKQEIYRQLRAEQLALTWRDTPEITPIEQSMLSILTNIQQLFNSEQAHRPSVMIEFQLATLATDPSDRWIVTFLYDLISHFELAGIQTLVWRQSSKDFYAKVKSDLLQHNYQEIDLSTELGCQCIFTVPSPVRKQDFQFTEGGYLHTLKILIKKLYNIQQQEEAYGRLWEVLSTIGPPSTAKMSQFMNDKCSLIAVVEARLAKLDLLTQPYNCSLPIAQGTQHVVVTKTDPMAGAEITALPGADIQINTIYAAVLRK